MADDIVLKSGHRIDANLGIVGINDELDISEGADGGIETPDNSWSRARPTAADMVELADIMLDRWRRFRAKWEAR